MRASLFVTAFVAAGCGGGAEPRPDPAAPAAAEARAAKAADALGGALMKELKAAMEAGGPAGAIPVCSEKAPVVAQGLSTDGVSVRRTSLRWRNPSNAPDDFERSVLEGWERDAKAGVVSKVVDGPGGRELRWMRPIRLQPVCVACHGAADEIVADVKAEIARRYPEDKATGFKDGDLRGAFSVRVRMTE